MLLHVSNISHKAANRICTCLPIFCVYVGAYLWLFNFFTIVCTSIYIYLCCTKFNIINNSRGRRGCRQIQFCNNKYTHRLILSGFSLIKNIKRNLSLSMTTAYGHKLTHVHVHVARHFLRKFVRCWRLSRERNCIS